ncbi:hypothetical protein ACFQL1_15970 [Halomicroarcula sp. GCM10025709]|uniref:hypothetical protein n=1 Tax=Haloarcula TaxID=2237 RepID=UPI0024C25DD5|nr:hypothetical protein [Halomicroarcula sp. YJ-61-S]
MDNGPSYEPQDLDLPDGVVYCVDCGNVFVYHNRRGCPTCHAWETAQEAVND